MHVGGRRRHDVGDRRAATGTAWNARSTRSRTLAVLEVAGRRDDEVRGDVGVGEVAAKRRLVERRHRLRLAEDRPAEWMLRPEPAGEDLVDEIVGRVLDHLDLFEDDFLLALDFGRVERRSGDEIREHVHGHRQVLVEHLDVVAGVFLRGERVEVAADRVDLLGDVLGGAGGRALEEHVLHEVGDAFVSGGLVPRTAAEPYADAHRPHVGHPLGEQAKSVGQDVADDGGDRHDAWARPLSRRPGHAPVASL